MNKMLTAIPIKEITTKISATLNTGKLISEK
jgi:hypothetical protein